MITLPVDEVRRRLAESFAPQWSAADTFSVRQRVRFTSFTMQIDGRLRPSPPGSEIDLTLRLGALTRVFMTIWLVAAAAIFVGFGIAALRDTTFGRQVGYAPLFMFPLGYGLCWAGFLLGAAQAKSSLDSVLH